jgi:hypothetical protein
VPVLKALYYIGDYRIMMEILGLGGILGLVSILLTIFFGTRKMRLKGKLKTYENQKDLLSKYVNTTGYKLILRDALFTLCYAVSISLFALGALVFVKLLYPNTVIYSVVSFISASTFLGSGLVLFEQCRDIGKTYKSERNFEKIDSKIKTIKSSVEHS